MSQTREKRDSLALSREDFWMIWRCHSILCFHFFFFFFWNNGVREQFNENNFRRCYDHFFNGKCHPEVLDHSYVPSSFPIVTRQLGNGIWKKSYKWWFYAHGSTKVASLHQYICLYYIIFPCVDRIVSVFSRVSGTWRYGLEKTRISAYFMSRKM